MPALRCAGSISPYAGAHVEVDGAPAGGVRIGLVGCRLVVPLVVRARGVLGDGECDVGHGEQCEDHRLDEPEEELQPEEDARHEEREGKDRDGGRGEGQHRREQDLAREDVAEEPHREADDAAQLADEMDREHERCHVARLTGDLF